MVHHTKVLIIGSGPAGCTAAIYAARAALNPIMVCGMEPGGQLTITTDVENYPGFADVIQGPWLMDQMQKQAEHVGAKIINDHIISVDFTKRPYTCVGQSGETYTGDTVIISTGAKARWLGLKSESEFQGFGVSACATCDGFFFKGKTVCVIGGGNSAVEEAIFLTNHAKKVYLIHRGSQLRAEKILQTRLFENKQIEIIWNTVLEEIVGTTTPMKGVTGVHLKNTQDGTTSHLSLDGVFVAIGHDPATELFKGKLDMDTSGYLLTKPDSTETSIPGVYAAGDVKDKIFRQAITAAGLGCMAALEAGKYLAEHQSSAQLNHKVS